MNKLNLDVEFNEWVPGKHWAINVLLYVKKLFHLETMFKLNEHQDAISNKDAHKLYNENFGEFMAEVKKSIQKSVDDRFKNPSNSLLKFSDYHPLHDRVLEQIKEHTQDDSSKH